jgi:hypothetical protein
VEIKQICGFKIMQHSIFTTDVHVKPFTETDPSKTFNFDGFRDGLIGVPFSMKTVRMHGPLVQQPMKPVSRQRSQRHVIEIEMFSMVWRIKNVK